MDAHVSLCMIVKNEENHLPSCLASVADLVDDIVVVDTGSCDRTKEIAQGFGARIFDFIWVDSFAAARNESIRHARGNWIFWLDADDRLDEVNRSRFAALTANLPAANIGYAMIRREVSDNSGGIYNNVRLFQNRPQIRWRYRVHEQIMLAVAESGGERRQSDVVIQHVGYVTPQAMADKAARNLRLLLIESAERPNDSFLLFNLGTSYQLLGRAPEAMEIWKRGIENCSKADYFTAKIFALLAQGLFRQGQSNDAVRLCQAGQLRHPHSIDLLFTESIIRRLSNDDVGAETCLLQILAIEPAKVNAGDDYLIFALKARHNLALLYLRQGREAEAELQWRQLLRDHHDFDVAWQCLKKLLSAQGRDQEFEEFRLSLEKPSHTNL